MSCVQECRLGETNPCNLNSNVILSGTHYEQDISITYYAEGNKQIANLSVRPESKYGYSIGQNVSVLVNGTVVKLEVDSSARDLIILALATTGYWIISVLLLREVKKTIAED